MQPVDPNLAVRRIATATNTSSPSSRHSTSPPPRSRRNSISRRRTSLEHCSEILQQVPASQDGALLQEAASRDVLPQHEAASKNVADWPQHSLTEIERMVACLFSNNLDTTTFSSDDLCGLTLEIFRAAGLPDLLAQDERRVQRLILGARDRMWTQNAYHSWAHVVDMTAAASDIATRTGAMARFSPWERFALLSSALLHDLDHPGVSNIENAEKLDKVSQAGLQYRSMRTASTEGLEGCPTLEDHHLRCALSLLEDGGVGMMAGMTSVECDDLRHSIAANILATDLKRHFAYTAQAHTMAEAAGGNHPGGCPGPEVSRPSPEVSHQLEMELIMKSADLSNCAKPFPVAARWALRVTDEFYAEGDALSRLGLAVARTHDRRVTSRAAVQRSFIDALALPWFDGMANMFPALAGLADGVRGNRAVWEGMGDARLEAMRDW